MLTHVSILYRCYYALQGIHNERFDETTGQLVECANDAERETERRQWVDALKTSLPASFRIGKDVPAFYQAQLARELDDFIQRAVSYRPQEDDVRDDSRGRSSADFAALEQTSVQTLSFLPYAYQLSLDRVALRKNPALKQLQEWLKMHSAEGHITRQGTTFVFMLCQSVDMSTLQPPPPNNSFASAISHSSLLYY
jgi:hypothetical protein